MKNDQQNKKNSVMLKLKENNNNLQKTMQMKENRKLVLKRKVG